MTIVLLLMVLVLSNCGTVESSVSDEQLIKYVKRWNSDFSAISGNLSYESNVLYSSINDTLIHNIVEKEFDNLEYGSQEYMEFLSQWVKNHIKHTQKQALYRDYIRKEPWNGTHKILLPYEMQRLGERQNVYMGKCSSIAHFVIALLRESGLDKDDYIVFAMADHTIAIFRYNDVFYVVDNNDIYQASNKVKEASPGLIGFYHEDLSRAFPIKLTAEFYEKNDGLSLSQRIIALNHIEASDIYYNNLSQEVRDYLEHKVDVANFEIYVKASIEEPNVAKLSKELTQLTDIFNWIETSIQLKPLTNRVQLADETIAYGSGTALDCAILVKAILTIQERQCEIYHDNEEVYIEVDGQRYNIRNNLGSYFLNNFL